MSPQCTIVLEHLTQAGTLSGREAADLYRIRDLPKRISELRQRGHNIVRVIRRDRLGQRYARYALAVNRFLLGLPV